jgi:hypothetical protein
MDGAGELDTGKSDQSRVTTDPLRRRFPALGHLMAWEGGDDGRAVRTGLMADGSEVGGWRAGWIEPMTASCV